MAQTWVCDNGDGQLAVTQVINVGNGDSEVYCGQCWATFVLALADAIRAANPDQAADTPAEPEPAPEPAPDPGEPLPFNAGPDDDSDDDEDESAALARGDSADVPHVGGLSVARGPRKRAPGKAAPRARVRGAS